LIYNQRLYDDMAFVKVTGSDGTCASCGPDNSDLWVRTGAPVINNDRVSVW
jgi:hypothetical protein